jgi:hypothetical protein
MKEAQTLGDVSHNLNDDITSRIHSLISQKVVPGATFKSDWKAIGRCTTTHESSTYNEPFSMYSIT